MKDPHSAKLPAQSERKFVRAADRMKACDAPLSAAIARHKQAWKQVGATPSEAAEEELIQAQTEMFARYEEMNNSIAAFDAVLGEYGIDPSDFETPLPRQKNRLWKEELQPAVVPQDAEQMEDGLRTGLSRLLELFPQAWGERQIREGQAAMRTRGSEAPFLLGGISAEPMLNNRFGYGLALAAALLEESPYFDIYEAPTLVPQITTLCTSLDALLSVEGGLDKLRELRKAPSGEVDSRLYELLVAARTAEMGRAVSFIPTDPASPTPDLRVHDVHFPVVIECKLQHRQAQVETIAISVMRDVRARFRAYKSEHPSLLGDLRVRFTIPVREIQSEEVYRDLQDMWKCLQPFQEKAFTWGVAEWRHLEPRIELESEVMIFCPLYFKQILPDYTDLNSDWDGFFMLVNDEQGHIADEVAMPFAVRWRVEHPADETALSRNVLRHLREAIDQIPIGEAGVLYIGLPHTQRASIADRRTRLLLDTLPEFFHTRRGVIAPMVEINRLSPHVLDLGQPDLIENAIPATQDAERRLHRYFPTLVFTRGDGADRLDAE